MGSVACVHPPPPSEGRGGGCTQAMRNGDILKLFLKGQVHGSAHAH